MEKIPETLFVTATDALAYSLLLGSSFMVGCAIAAF